MIPGRNASTVGEEIGQYLVHYADGSSEVLLIRAGIDVDDWKPTREPPLDDTEIIPTPEGVMAAPVVGWGGFAGAGMDEVTTTLFVTSWTNPKPDVRIESIDFTSSGGRTIRPFLVALTLAP